MTDNGNHLAPYKPLIISPIELEHVILTELHPLGIEHVVFMVLDQWFHPQINITHGFSSQQLGIYQENQHHDAFLNHYLKSHLVGQLVYMQEMLPVREIDDAVFLEVLIPTMQMHHSYCGLHSVTDHHHMMLSGHSFRKLNPRQQKKLTEIWCFLRHWSNGWVSNQLVSQHWSKFNDTKCHRDKNAILTLTETRVLELLVQGLDGVEIASHRGVSKETVRTQIKQVLHKTGCKHQNQLISRYFHHQLAL
ncbi:helix-turn-helix transcriptional regulator [Vibrio sp. ZSDE26]|uniref:Helix-turn-helix transcriptional regulator n=1 Tax=Vibrio amylolyticus TaxID=2847292 RepID=A0A9X1XLX5_9VIBR|nr:helix-turn-helix transcriptional regulator [Vibrio amylolyticus]MCK6264133.1 helix-turn-helix transcriptional regulator [Vibrio amylolyticus]